MIDTTHDAPSVQVDGKTIYLRSSALGKCPRALAALALNYGEVRSERLELAAEEGHLHERAVEKRIKEKFNLVLKREQDICNHTFEVNGWTFVLTGHREGLLCDPISGTPVFLWENKSGSQNQFELWEKSLPAEADGKLPSPTFKNHPTYAWQISAYMLCEPVGLPVLYSFKNRNTGELVFSVLREAPWDEAAIVRRLERVLEIMLGGDAALHNNANCEDGANTWFCPMREQLSCGQRDTLEAEEDFDPAFEGWLIEYRAMTEQESKAKKRKKELSPLIKKHVRQGRLVTLLGYEASVGKRKYQDTKALDAFLAEHGKTRDDFMRESDVLNVKPPKGM